MEDVLSFVSGCHGVRPFCEFAGDLRPLQCPTHEKRPARPLAKEGQTNGASFSASTCCYIYSADSCERCVFHHFSAGCVKMWHCGLQLKLPGHFRPQPCQSCHSHSLMFPQRRCAWGALVSAVPPATWRHWAAS